MSIKRKEIVLHNLKNWVFIQYYINMLFENIYYPFGLKIIIPSSTFAMPGPSLLIGTALERIKKHRNEHNLLTEIVVNNSYLSYIGFSSLVGASGATEIGAAAGSYSYVPIKRLSPSKFIIEDDIVDYAKELARITAPHDINIRKILSYSLQELLRNIYNHADFETAYLMGQQYRNGTAEIAIVDDGKGVLRALRGRYPEITSDMEAVQYAIEPGVSSGSETQGNAGFGLYVLSEIGHRYGAFWLGSGKSALYINTSTTRKYTYSSNFIGTHVLLFFQYNQSRDFFKEFKEIVEIGEYKIGEKKKGLSKTII